MQHGCRDHEDDQQDQHDVDEGRDVDVGEVVEGVAGLPLEGHSTR